MKDILHTLLRTTVLATGFVTGIASAADVTGEVPDTLPGNSAGGLSGFMIGAAAGGPVGAVVGSGIGWLVGGETQEATGLSGTAYQVTKEDGSKTVIRSPKKSWSKGDQVRIVGSRLVSNDSVNRSQQPAALLANH